MPTKIGALFPKSVAVVAVVRITDGVVEGEVETKEDPATEGQQERPRVTQADAAALGARHQRRQDSRHGTSTSAAMKTR